MAHKVVVGHGLTIAERGQRIAVRIKQGKIKIAGTGSVDALLVLKPEFGVWGVMEQEIRLSSSLTSMQFTFTWKRIVITCYAKTSSLENKPTRDAQIGRTS